MLLSRYLRRLCIVLAGAASLVASAAHAALPAAESDLLLCFRATDGLGANTNYLVNIGPVSQFVGTNGAVTVDVGGNIAADLETIYGSDWHTRPDVAWSVSGVQKTSGNGFPSNTIFASRAQISVGTQSDPWTRPSAFAAGTPALKLLALRDPGYTAGTKDDSSQIESTNSTKALVQSNNAQNSYSSYMPGGSNTTGLSAFSYFNAAGTIEATFANGAPSSVVDLYKLEPGTGPGTHLGGFRLSSAGVLTFNSDITFFQGPALVNLDSATYSVSEDVVTGNVVLTVQRSGNLNSAFSLNVSTTDGTAVGGTDYATLTNATVNFAASETSKTVEIAITNRAGFQGDRSFTVTLSPATGSPQLATPSTATVTILETTPQPSILALSAATYDVAENAAGGTVTITVNRTGATNSTATVELSTQNGTAIGGTDFTAQSATLVSFAANDTTETVDIPIVNRTGFQGNRQFTVSLANASAGAQLNAPQTASVTILENEPNPAGRIAFATDNLRVAARLGTNLPNTATITLVRTNGTTGAVSVSLALAAGGNLTAGEDFTFTSPTVVNFADGQDFATVQIPLALTAAPVPGSFNLQLSNPTNGASLGTIAALTVTLTAPDAVAPKLIVTSPKAGKSGATFDVAGNVQDPDNIDRVEVRLNGGVPQLATVGTKTGSTTPFTLNGLNAENGPNVLLVQAFDVNGTATKITQVKFTFTNTRPLLAGIYAGLIKPTAVAPPGNDLHNASGYFSISVNATGAFSGKVFIGGATLPIGGIIANDQSARFKSAYGPAITLASKGKAAVTFGELAFSITGTEVNGTLGTTATVTAARAAFDGKTPATTPDADYLANKGKYTGAFPAKTQGTLTAAQFPQGDGVGNITVTKQGKVSFKGKLADGTPVSMSGALSADLEVAFYAALYAKKGSLAGLVKLDKSQADSDLEGADFLWLRPANVKAKHYPAGWPTGVKTDLVGARYAVPTGSSVLPGLGSEDPVAGNAELVAEIRDPAATVTKSVNVSVKNKVTNVPATDKTFKLTIAAPTGAVSGFFPHPSGAKTTFSGIILQKGANQGAFGYYLTVVPRGGPAGESGGISVSAK